MVNIEQLTAIAGQRDTVFISMAPPDSIDIYRENIYLKGKTASEKHLESQLAKKNSQLRALLSEKKQNVAEINLLRLELKQIEDKRKTIEEQSKNLAEEYGQVNLDDASPIFTRAFTLFQNGYLDSAQYLLSHANVRGKVDSVLLERKRIDLDKQSLKIRDSVERMRSDTLSRLITLKINFDQLSFHFDSVRSDFQQLIKLKPGNADNLLKYGNFLQWINDNLVALDYYKKVLDIYRRRPDNQTDDHQKEQALLLGDMGVLYKAIVHTTEAENCYLEARDILKKLAEKHPRRYAMFLGNIQRGLGDLYSYENNYPKAERLFNLSIKTYQDCPDKNATNYLSNYAQLLVSIGDLYRDESDFRKAEPLFLQAQEIRAALMKKDSIVFTGLFASGEEALGDFYERRREYAKADSAYHRALTIRTRLTKINPQTNLPDLADTQNSLGDLYEEENKYEKALPCQLAALEIYKKLIQSDPETYEPDITNVYNSLGSIYADLGDVDNAEKAYRSCLDIWTRLCKNHADTYEPLRASALSNLSNLYEEKQEHSKAEQGLLKTLAIYQEIANKQKKTIGGLTIYSSDIADTKVSLGDVYVSENKLEKAKNMYLSSLEIRKKLLLQDFRAFAPDVAGVLIDLGNLYDLQKASGKAEGAYVESLQIYQKLAKGNPIPFLSDVAAANYNLAVFYFNKGYEQKAEVNYLQAADLYNKIMHDDTLAYALNLADCYYNLSEIYKSRKDTVSFINNSSKCIIYYSYLNKHSRLNNSLNEGYVYNTLGNAYLGKKYYDLAEAAFLKSIEAKKRSAGNKGALTEIASVQNNLALVYLNKRQFRKSDSCFVVSLQNYLNGDKSDTAEFKRNINRTSVNLLTSYIREISSVKYVFFKSVHNSSFDTLKAFFTNTASANKRVAVSLARLYCSRSWYLLFASKFQDAENEAKAGLAIDPGYVRTKTNLALALLFQNRLQDALTVYKELKSLKDESNKPYSQICIEDIEELAAQKILNQNTEKIKAFMLQP